MPNGKNPLMLMMALAMPGAVQAIGLGDIHVDSALNERLVAEIDIIGATPLELADLRAAVANRETFVRYGVDRPAFLSSATFKVTQNSQGRPVLAIRSTDSFTEPLVNFLVDLRWRNGEFVREYTLLLDPPNFASDAPALAAPAPATAPVAAPAPQGTPTAENKNQTVADAVPVQTDSGAERSARKTTEITVGAKATLRGIAWRLGERSPSDLQRMMIAIFRANPAAFDGNINRMYLGAVLRVPSQQDLESISKEDAHREFHAQMEAWRSSSGLANTMVAHRAAPATTPTGTSAATPTGTLTTAPAIAANNVVATAPDQEAKALSHRIESLEQELAAVKSLLDSENHQFEALQQQELNSAKAEHGNAAKAEHGEAAREHGDAQPAASTAVAAAGATAAAVTVNSAGAPAAETVNANPADATVSANPADATVKATSADARAADRANTKPADATVKATSADAPAAATGSAKVPATGAAADESNMHGSLAAAAVGLGTLGAALAALYFRLRRRKTASQAETIDDLTDNYIAASEEASRRVQPTSVQPTSAPQFETEFLAQPLPAPEPQAAAPQPPADDSVDDQALEAAIEAAAIYDSTHPMLPVISDSDATVAMGSLASDSTVIGPSHPASSDATAKLPVDAIDRRATDRRAVPENTRVDTRLDYNLIDLDMTVQHVNMPSALNESPVMKERRTNLADVLKQALEREPNRDDLRMKLLELYFSAATLNRNGFLEVVQKLAQNRPNYRQSEEWQKIAFMGRQILSDNPLFLEELAGEVDLQIEVEDVRKVS